ncbi:MAG: sigma-70 family RNA polymerase sigma factor [Rubricoccaceae bacterium]|nr:sigma-70 family RNA polymerase sigma factor [Rubricoccaceae bacterium]
MAPASDVTTALDALRGGDTSAEDRLLRAVYDELRRLAHRQRRHERRDHTLNTTALVHEAYFKLLGPDHRSFDNRAHFFSAAARAMRQVLVDYARARGRAKRGGGQQALSLSALSSDPSDPNLLTDERAAEILDLDEALGRLAQLDARQARVVECRYFGGLSVEETAEALDVSAATVKREWRSARAWLYATLHRSPDDSGG